MLNNRFQIALIGAGMIAEKHASALRKFNNVDIRWVIRQNPDKLPEFRNKFNIPFGSCNYRDALNDTYIDAIIITSPPHTHKELFIAGLKAGKHILLEKPAAVSVSEIDEMQTIQKNYPHIHVCDCSCRHTRLQPMFAKVKEIIDSGILGHIYYIHQQSVALRSRPGIEYHPTAHWFYNKSLSGGGPALDLGVYDFSFTLGILSDKPTLQWVKPIFCKNHLDTALRYPPNFSVEEHFAALLGFDEGLTYYWERASHANNLAEPGIRIYGTRGGLRFSHFTWEGDNGIELFDSSKPDIQTRIEVDFSQHIDDDYQMAHHFIAMLEDREKPAMPLHLAAKHLGIIFSVYDSFRHPSV
jgi:predicted dehydrogenase